MAVITTIFVMIIFFIFMFVVVKFIGQSAKGNFRDNSSKGNGLGDFDFMSSHITSGADTIRYATNNLISLRTLASRISTKDQEQYKLKIILDEICNSFDNIIKYVSKNPEKLSESQVFLDKYVPIVVKSSQNYVDSLSFSQSSATKNLQYSKLLIFLKDTKKAFDNHLDKQLKRDLAETNIEMDSLTSVFMSEGLVDNFEEK